MTERDIFKSARNHYKGKNSGGDTITDDLAALTEAPWWLVLLAFLIPINPISLIFYVSLGAILEYLGYGDWGILREFNL